MKNRIKQIRKDLKLTQTEFGEKIGIKGNTVTNYENGLRTPSDAVIFSICREFGVNEEWLRTGEGEPYVVLSEGEVIAEFVGKVLKEKDDSFKRRLISILSSLDEAGWEAFERVVEELSKINKE